MVISLNLEQYKPATQIIHRNRSLILSFYKFEPNLAMNTTLYNFLPGSFLGVICEHAVFVKVGFHQPNEAYIKF